MFTYVLITFFIQWLFVAYNLDWIIKTTTKKSRRNGISWTLWSQLEDLDFADGLALLSHSHEHEIITLAQRTIQWRAFIDSRRA